MFLLPSLGRILESVMLELFLCVFVGSLRKEDLRFIWSHLLRWKTSHAPRRSEKVKVRGIVQSRGRARGQPWANSTIDGNGGDLTTAPELIYTKIMIYTDIEDIEFYILLNTSTYF
jgi:hypothetical protein